MHVWWLVSLGTALADPGCTLPRSGSLPRAVRALVRRPKKRWRAGVAWLSQNRDAPAGVRLRLGLALAPHGDVPDPDQLLTAWGGAGAEAAWCRSEWAPTLLPAAQAMTFRGRAWRALDDGPRAERLEAEIVAWVEAQPTPQARFEAADALLGTHPVTVTYARPLLAHRSGLRAHWRVALYEASTGTRVSEPSDWEVVTAEDHGADDAGGAPLSDGSYWTEWDGAVSSPGADAVERLLGATRAEWMRSGVQDRAAAWVAGTMAAALWHDDCGVRPVRLSRARRGRWHGALEQHLAGVFEAVDAIRTTPMPVEGHAALSAAELHVAQQCAAALAEDRVPVAADSRARIAQVVGRLPTEGLSDGPVRRRLLEAVAGTWSVVEPAVAGAAGRWVAAQGTAREALAQSPSSAVAPASASAFLTPLVPALADLPPDGRREVVRRWLPTVRHMAGRAGRLALIGTLDAAPPLPEHLEGALVAVDAGQAGGPDAFGAVVAALSVDAVQVGLDLVDFASLADPERVIVQIAPELGPDWSRAERVVQWAIYEWEEQPGRGPVGRAAGRALVGVVRDHASVAIRAGRVADAVDDVVELVPALSQGDDDLLVAVLEELVVELAAGQSRGAAVLTVEELLEPGTVEWCRFAREAQSHGPPGKVARRWRDHRAECGPRAAYRVGAEDTEELVPESIAALERALAALDQRNVVQLRRALGLAAAVDGGRALGSGQASVADLLLSWSRDHVDPAERARVDRLRAVGLGRQGRWDEAREALPAEAGLGTVVLQRAIIDLRSGRVADAGRAFLSLVGEAGLTDAATVNLGIAAERRATRDLDQAVGWLDQARARVGDDTAAARLLEVHRLRLVPGGEVADLAGVQGPPRVLNALARQLGELGAPEQGAALIDSAMTGVSEPRTLALLAHSRAELQLAAGKVDAAAAAAVEAWERALAVGDGETAVWAAKLRADIEAARGNAAAAVLFGKLALRSLSGSPYSLACTGCTEVDAIPVLAERVSQDLLRTLLATRRTREAQRLIEHQSRSALGDGWPVLPLTRLEQLAWRLLLAGDEPVLDELEVGVAQDRAAPVLGAGVARLSVHIDAGGGVVEAWSAAGHRQVALTADHAAQLAMLARAARDPGTDPMPAARAVYDAVVRPVEDLLGSATTLQVAATGAASEVPWAAAHDGERWLAERFVLWRWTEQARAPEARLGPSSGMVVGFAATAGGPGLAPLPAARAEVAQVADVAYVDGDFTRTSLRSALWQRPQVVHLATHFVLDPPRGEAFLALGDGSELSVPDLATWRFHGVSLVVLSACDTANPGGATRLGSVASMIQRQGAARVVGTLWPVADLTTSIAMQELHRGLADGLDAGAALQRAQRALWMGHPVLGSGVRGLESVPSGDDTAPLGTQHPFYWAPFVVH